MNTSSFAEIRTLILITNRALFTWKEMKVDTHLIETLQKRLIADAQVITLKILYNFFLNPIILDEINSQTLKVSYQIFDDTFFIIIIKIL